MKDQASQHDFSFPRAARLLKHSAFENVYNSGRRHFSTSFTAFYLIKPATSEETATAQVGLTVGRALGGAVVRNRMKRRMRNLVRQHLTALNRILRERKLTAEIVINPKKSSLTADFDKLHAEIARAFEVIGSAKVESKA